MEQDVTVNADNDEASNLSIKMKNDLNKKVTIKFDYSLNLNNYEIRCIFTIYRSIYICLNICNMYIFLYTKHELQID